MELFLFILPWLQKSAGQSQEVVNVHKFQKIIYEKRQK